MLSQAIFRNAVYHIQTKVVSIKVALPTCSSVLYKKPSICVPHTRDTIHIETYFSLANSEKNINRSGVLRSVCLPQTLQVRGKKDKKAGVKKGGKPKVQLSQAELNEIINFKHFEEELNKSLEKLKQEYAENITIRSSGGKMDNIVVDTADGKFQLIHLAQITQKGPDNYVLDLTASPQYIGNVKTALSESSLNLNVQQEKTTLFATLPKFTFEKRTQLAKSAKELANRIKDVQRNIYHEYTKKIDRQSKEESFSDDYIRNLTDTLLFSVKKYNDETESLMKVKQAELLGEEPQKEKKRKH